MTAQSSREFDGGFGDEYVPKNKKRKPVGKDLELLNAKVEAEVQATQVATGEVAPEIPMEVTPEPLPEPAVVREIIPEKPIEIVAPPKMEVRTEVENTKINSGVVWYEGILDDLKIVTSSGDEWSDVEWNKRREIATRLRNKGVKLPPLSVDEKDRVAYGNRQQFQGAVEYLNPLFTGRYRKEAIAYLNNMGIGDRTGQPFLPGSEEAKQAEKKVEVDDPAVKEYEEKERKANILNWLTLLSDSKDEGEKEGYLSALEDRGVKIRKFLEDAEGMKPEQAKDLGWLGAVVKWWGMDEAGKQKYPDMQKLADYVAGRLGL